MNVNQIVDGIVDYKNISSVPTRFLPLTVSVIVRVTGKLVRLELEETC